MPRLLRDLERVCSGEVGAEELLAERVGTSPWRERPSPAVLPEVVVDDRASPRHTVVEVFAKDRPGLLYSLARAFHGLGLSIAFAIQSLLSSRRRMSLAFASGAKAILAT